MANKEELYNLLKIAQKEEKIREIQAEMNDPSFWQDSEKSKNKMEELASINKIINQYNSANTEEDIKKLEILALMNEKYDDGNAIISIHAGAGGTEAQDWAEMLLNMFEKYAKTHDYDYSLIEISSGNEAGIKSATLKIIGQFAYGKLKYEAGVHRLVRISPFDSDKARHTSFALVEVIPEISEKEDLPIDEKDLRIDVYHSGGHGGQSVNTTDSAVRITHLPSGIVVACQNERSQGQNKALAMKILKSKLLSIKIKEQKEEELKMRGEHLSAEWGNQIRSYVLHPYKQVKDHRTEVTSTNPDEILNGKLDEFIDAMLRKIKN